MYKRFRPLQEVKVFGDYPLLAHLIYLTKLSISGGISRRQVLRAVNNSTELSSLCKGDKSQVISSLLQLQK